LLQVVSVYDNTAGNRNNPDPKRWAGYGQQSVDEMAVIFMQYFELTQAEYDKRVAERKQQSATAESGQSVRR
jgi:hypothetical protein